MAISTALASGQYFSLVPWVVFLPLIGLLLNLLFGRWLGEKVAGAFASLAVGLAFVVSILLAISLAAQPQPVTVPLLDWIQAGDLQVSWAFRVDTLSVLMMLVVSGVGTLIHVYAIGYMHEDVRLNGDPGRFTRFFVYFNLFIAAMMILVSADSYLMMFVGWEGVGLCSYLLIGFWYEKGKDGIGNAKAAKKAFIVNRIGDFGFLIAMFLLFGAFKSLNFTTIFAHAPEVGHESPGLILAVTLFLLLGVAGKSAQLPLYVWLPDAMAGPTPVSALIHAATMVTAGVYLVARSQPLYSIEPTAQFVVATVGALTAFFAATIAVGQFDIKKILAYSTISQLGFMIWAVGMGAVTAGLFHLVTHAFFKALLFLGAGSVIQGVEYGAHHSRKKHNREAEEHELDVQDIRNLGGLKDRMKVTFWVYLAGALALAGIPPLAGFFSKDEILGEASKLSLPFYIILAVASVLTAFYMTRQVLLVFFGKPRSDAAAGAKENPPLITVPLILLAILSIVGGALNLPGVFTLEHWLGHTLVVQPGEFIVWVALVSTFLALVGLATGWVLYGRKPLVRGQDEPLRRILGPVFTGMEMKWWVDEFYGKVIVEPYQRLAQWLDRAVDQGLIDTLANGLGSLTRWVSEALRKLQTGLVRSYALFIALGVAAILGYLILR